MFKESWWTILLAGVLALPVVSFGVKNALT